MTREEQILELAGQTGFVRPRDLTPFDIPRIYLSRMVDKGLLVRYGRGLYALPDAPIGEHHSLAQVAKQVPEGVICLLTALRFHDLTTQDPFEVWLAVAAKARQPFLDTPQLRVVHFSGKAFTEGVESHMIEHVTVRLYNPAKTVADCFKYRHKIGLDVALEALRACWQTKKCTMDELWHYAAICRVQNVMRPYLEALVL